jgi:hypothetical protein
MSDRRRALFRLISMVHKFKSGDRIRLSQLGKERNPRMRKHHGTVIKVGSRANSSEILAVQLDGNASLTRLHRSYVEPLCGLSKTCDRSL